ncbi:hypothetical protein ACHAWF_019040 [Thalassiosira exigua]
MDQPEISRDAVGSSRQLRRQILPSKSTPKETKGDDGIATVSKGCKTENATSKRQSVCLSSEEDSVDDANAPSCAVCFLDDDQRHKWRRLVTLPCCGSDGKEGTSSTRFCAACILRMTTMRADPSSSNEYAPGDPERHEAPTKRFYVDNCQTDARRFLECPRCRDILVVDVERKQCDGDEDVSDSGLRPDCSGCEPKDEDWSDPKAAHSIGVRSPSFKERCRYVGKKIDIAPLLWRATFLRHDFMPGSILGQHAEKLVHWGVLRRERRQRSVETFVMDKSHHDELVELMTAKQKGWTQLDFERNCALIIGLLWTLGATALEFAMHFHLCEALKTGNQLGRLVLYFAGYLPKSPNLLLSAQQEWAMAALNLLFFATSVLLTGLVFVRIGHILVAGLCGWYVLRRNSAFLWQLGIGLCIAYRAATLYMDDSKRTKSIWFHRCLLVYAAYRVVAFFCNSCSVTYGVALVIFIFGVCWPRAMAVIKEKIRGSFSSVAFEVDRSQMPLLLGSA